MCLKIWYDECSRIFFLQTKHPFRRRSSTNSLIIFLPFSRYSWMLPGKFSPISPQSFSSLSCARSGSSRESFKDATSDGCIAGWFVAEVRELQGHVELSAWQARQIWGLALHDGWFVGFSTLEDGETASHLPRLEVAPPRRRLHMAPPLPTTFSLGPQHRPQLGSSRRWRAHLHRLGAAQSEQS